MSIEEITLLILASSVAVIAVGFIVSMLIMVIKD